MTDIHPIGPWVLVKVHPPSREWRGLYLPEGNIEERIGHQIGEVLAVGQGYRSTDKELRKSGKKYQDHGISKGDTVIFRGFLKDANRPNQLDRERCLLHAQDILGVVDGPSVSL